MQEINIEQIMEEIRADIKAKGYKESDLSFSDISMPELKEQNLDTRYDAQKLLNLLHALNTSTRVDYYKPITDGGIKGMVKKIIRKVMKPLLLPLCQGQEQYNGINAQTMNQLQLYIEQLEKRIDDLEAIITREDK